MNRRAPRVWDFGLETALGLVATVGLHLVACVDVNNAGAGGAGDSCTKTSDCATGLRCMELTCIVADDGATTGDDGWMVEPTGQATLTSHGSSVDSGMWTSSSTVGTSTTGTTWTDAGSSTLSTTSTDSGSLTDAGSSADAESSTAATGSDSESGQTTGVGSSTSSDAGSGSTASGSTDSGSTATTGGTDDEQCEGDHTIRFVWVANSGEGTLSKIDVESVREVARYRTGVPGNVARGLEPDPSRVAVNRCGDVAVANRSGSVVKIAGDLEHCVDRNGNGRIDTSLGPTDIRPWGEDECTLWYHDLPFTDAGTDDNLGGPRAVAWDHGDPTQAIQPGCRDNAGVWVGWRQTGSSNSVLRYLDGCTAAVLDDIELQIPHGHWEHGLYGAAVDGAGNLWTMTTVGNLVRVDGITHEYETWNLRHEGDPVYGLALDHEDRPTLSVNAMGGIVRFDPTTEVVNRVEGRTLHARGLSFDAGSQAWVAHGMFGNVVEDRGCSLGRYDGASGTLGTVVELPGCAEPVGTSVDGAGRVWVVDRGSNRVFRYDPQNGEVRRVDGLNVPYSYGDLTGMALLSRP